MKTWICFNSLSLKGTPIDEKDNEGYTALQYAAMWGDLEATKWLIENGADVNTTDRLGINSINERGL